MIAKGTKVWAASSHDDDWKSDDGVISTGIALPCRLEGCTGRKYDIRWFDGRHTRCCTKGMKTLPNGELRIL